MSDVTRYIRKNIASLEPYSTARDDYQGDLGIFLDANENPYPNGYNRYPDPRQKELKSLIAGIKGVRAGQVFIGNGSDEAIDLCYRIFCEPGRSSCISIAPSYGMYKVAAAINDVELKEIALNPDFSLPVEKLLASCDPDVKIIFLCSPNNPTANAFPLEQLCTIVERFDGIVVVDEAYVDFSDKGTMLSVLDRYPSLIVLQTLSKAWGLAGLRLGLAFMSEELSGYFSMVKYPYNISGLTQKTVSGMLSGGSPANLSEILSERERVAGALAGMPSVLKVYPSDANFLLVKVKDAPGMYDSLVSRGVIVRDRSKCMLCDNCLRITIGTARENDVLLSVVKEYQ